MAKKITISKLATIALAINRPSIKKEKYVYIAIANKFINYPHGRSKIVYIGQTAKGKLRLATSAAERAFLLTKHGIKSLTYYIVIPKGHQHTKSWKLLETALLAEFLYQWGDKPLACTQGKNYTHDKPSVKQAKAHFTREMTENLILEYSKGKI
jgi:hypothetical protein